MQRYLRKKVILRISYDVQLEGSSLFPLIKSKSKKAFCKYIFIEESPYHILRGIIKDHRWKYIFTEKSYLRDIKKLGNEELFDLENDPHELNNLVKQKPQLLKIMRDKLDFYENYCEKRKTTTSQAELDNETIQHLRSLGYLQ